MASIVKRNNRYCVVYTYKHTNGTLKQKWETFTDLADAKNRKKEVEYKESVGTFVAPQCRTLKDLLKEYVTLYGRTKWALSTYQSNTALISNYIEPLIGSMKLQDLTTRVIEGYYQRLLKYEAVDPMCGKRQHQYVSPGTVRSVHKILRSAFEQAVKWELMEKNPCIYATLPKYTAKKRDIWTAETLFHALEVCDDPRLRLCINLSFSCSLRLGELLGLTWDCVDFKKGTVTVCKQLQKRPAEAGGFQFAALKNDKTRILRPAPFVMDMLRAVRSKQAQRRLQAGDLWQDWIDPAKQYAACRLVFTNALGDHLHPQRLYAHHKKIAAKAGAPDARVHDLRHTFAVLSLQNGDDVKTVQENLGHATAAFTLDVYGHVSERMKEDSAARMQGYFENLKKARKKLRRSHHRRSCFCPR